MKIFTDTLVFADKHNCLEVCYHCALIEGYTTLQACERLCERYSSCDTAASEGHDVLLEVERREYGGE